MRQREKTLISKVIPEYVQEASLLQIDCHVIIMIDPSLHIIKDPFFHSGDCEASLDADLLDTLRWLIAHNVHSGHNVHNQCLIYLSFS